MKIFRNLFFVSAFLCLGTMNLTAQNANFTHREMTTDPSVLVYRGTTPTVTSVAELNTGLLSNADSIYVSGTWNDAEFTALKNSIKTSVAGGNQTVNAMLKLADLSEATFDGEMSNSTDYFFRECNVLHTIIFPEAIIPNLVSFYGAFQNCFVLTNLVNFDHFTGLTSLRIAFYGCEELTSIVLPEGTTAESICFSGAFFNCYELKSVTNFDKFNNIDGMETTFYQCTSLETVDMPNGTTKDEISMYSTFYVCQSLTAVNNLDAFTNVNCFDDAFAGCLMIESVTLPAGTTADSVTFAGTFMDCNLLSTINNLEKFDNVESYEMTFYNCYALTDIYLSEVVSERPVAIYFSFGNCSNLKHIHNLENYTNPTYYRGAFGGCGALEEVRLGADPNNIEEYYIADAFEETNLNCLKYLPEGVTTIPLTWKSSGYTNFVLPLTVVDITAPEAFEAGDVYTPETPEINPFFAANNGVKWQLSATEDFAEIAAEWNGGESHTVLESENGYYLRAVALSPNPEYNAVSNAVVIAVGGATGCAEQEMAPLAVYPNPATDVIRIASDKAMNSVEIYSLTGSRVYASNDQFVNVEISDLKAGAYIIIATDVEGTQYKGGFIKK